MNNQEAITEVRAKLNLTEIGVIISLVCSFTVAVFTAGIMYAQVQNNTDRIQEMEPKVDQVQIRLERIDANLEFLTDLAKRERGID